MRTKSGTFTTEYGNDNVTKTVDAVKNVVKKTVSAVKSVVTNVAGKVSTAAKAVTQTVKTVVNTAKTMAGIARTDGLKNALSGLPTLAKATAWQGKVIQAAAKAAIQADNARTAQELAETKAEARQIVADWAGGVYEEFSPRNQKIIDDTVEKVRELLANGASPAEIKRVIRGACTEVAKNVGEMVVEGVKEGVAQLTQKGTYETPDEAAVEFGKIAQPLTDKSGKEMMSTITQKYVLKYIDGKLHIDKAYEFGSLQVGMHNNVIFPTVAAAIDNLFGLKDYYIAHTHPYCTSHANNSFSSGFGDQAVVDFLGAKGIYLVEPKTGKVYVYDQNGKDINTLNLEIEQGLPIDVGETGYTNKNRFDCQGSAFFENPTP